MKRFLCVMVILASLVLSACSTPSTTAVKPAPTPAAATTVKPTPTPVVTTTPAVTTTAPSPTQTTVKPTVKQWPEAPAMQIDTAKPYFASVETSLGTFKIQLLANETPRTVNNFVFLSQQGFYDGVIFHRVIKTFMIQTGDPTGTGRGSPGYAFKDELPPKHSYDPGIVAMANSGPNTQGSQFFICTGPDAKNLNGMPNYTQFGQVAEGMDVVQKIASVPVGPGNPGENSRPTNPPVIKKITISNN